MNLKNCINGRLRELYSTHKNHISIEKNADPLFWMILIYQELILCQSYVYTLKSLLNCLRIQLHVIYKELPRVRYF